MEIGDIQNCTCNISLEDEVASPGMCFTCKKQIPKNQHNIISICTHQYQDESSSLKKSGNYWIDSENKTYTRFICKRCRASDGVSENSKRIPKPIIFYFGDWCNCNPGLYSTLDSLFHCLKCGKRIVNPLYAGYVTGCSHMFPNRSCAIKRPWLGKPYCQICGEKNETISCAIYCDACQSGVYDWYESQGIY